MPTGGYTYIDNVCIATSMTTAIAIMGETSKLSLNTTKKASLRTTVPMSIVRQWNLKAGDELDWSWEVIKGEMVVRVRKAGKK